MTQNEAYDLVRKRLRCDPRESINDRVARSYKTRDIRRNRAIDILREPVDGTPEGRWSKIFRAARMLAGGGEQ